MAGKRFKCPKCGTVNVARPQETPVIAPSAAPKPAPVKAAPSVAAGAVSATPKPPPAVSAPLRPAAASPSPVIPPKPKTASAATGDLVELQGAMALANKSSTQWLRWLFLLAIIPLAFSVFAPKPKAIDPKQVAPAFQQRLKERLAARPDMQQRVTQLEKEGLSVNLLIAWADLFSDTELKAHLEELNDQITALSKQHSVSVDKDSVTQLLEEIKASFMLKHCGLQPPPFLPKKTWGHWGLAGLAAILFLSYFCFAYPRGNAKVGHLLGVGFFTGTIGIVMLLAVQWLAGLATALRMRGGGIIMLIWLILVALAFSYAAADDPSNGFFLSFLGFTFGVGLIEELCKLLPLIWVYRNKGELDWRGACVYGLASGAGFGISEGIMYSARYYNGESQLGMYVVRFVSCAAMHAAWAGAACILLQRRRDQLQGELAWMDWVRALAPVLAVPMVLHGLYDTLLKTDMAAWALATGVVSYAFFIWLQEREAREQTTTALNLMAMARKNASRPTATW